MGWDGEGRTELRSVFESSEKRSYQSKDINLTDGATYPWRLLHTQKRTRERLNHKFEIKVERRNPLLLNSDTLQLYVTSHHTIFILYHIYFGRKQITVPTSNDEEDRNMASDCTSQSVGCFPSTTYTCMYLQCAEEKEMNQSEEIRRTAWQFIHRNRNRLSSGTWCSLRKSSRSYIRIPLNLFSNQLQHRLRISSIKKAKQGSQSISARPG